MTPRCLLRRARQSPSGRLDQQRLDSGITEVDRASVEIQPDNSGFRRVRHDVAHHADKDAGDGTKSQKLRAPWLVLLPVVDGLPAVRRRRWGTVFSGLSRLDSCDPMTGTRPLAVGLGADQ
jgi:hypothetical protein